MSVSCFSSAASFPSLAAALSAVSAAGPGCRVGVVGSRSFPALGLVSLFVASLPAGCVVVSGGCRGVDSVAQVAAEARGLWGASSLFPFVRGIGRAGGPIRNRQLVASCSVVVVFRSLGGSHGSESVIQLCGSLRVPCFVVSPPAVPGSSVPAQLSLF
jgi:hypothetical protein